MIYGNFWKNETSKIQSITFKVLNSEFLKNIILCI